MPQQANQPLPAGYVLNGYRIEKPLSSGGFSIVYLARDEAGTQFAIKEYLPSSLPLRPDGVEIATGTIDIPAGTSVRFAPGESKEVVLTEFGGTGELLGLNALTEGSWKSEANKAEALTRARARGFKGA